MSQPHHSGCSCHKHDHHHSAKHQAIVIIATAVLLAVAYAIEQTETFAKPPLLLTNPLIPTSIL